MTKIDFYTHTENKFQTACVLAAKAVTRGMKVMVFTPDSVMADKLDKLMWSYSAIGFLPHCRVEDKLAEVTPIVIDHLGTNFLHDDVLINMHQEQPAFFSRFQRLIEIVGLDQEDRQFARNRFRFYRDRGYELQSHDLSKQNNPG